MENANGRLILLVEDEPIIAMAEREKLRDFGYEVFVANTGEKAVEYVEKAERVDLVLMDIGLGRGISGTEAARRMLALKPVPVVFLTAHAEQEVLETVRGLTRYGYVMKNSGSSVLRSSIEMALELFAAHEELRAANEALAGRERLHASILRASPDNITITDLAGAILLHSPKALGMFGYEGESDSVGVGRNIVEFLAPEDRERAATNFGRMLGGESLGIEEYRGLRRDGSTFDVGINGEILRAASGAPEAAIFIVRDISAHKETERELRRKEAELNRQVNLFTTLLDKLPVGVFMVEAPTGRPLVANETAKRLLGRGILPGASRRNLAEVYNAFKAGTGEPYPPEEMPITLGMEGKSVRVDDLVVVKPDGGRALLEISGAPVMDSGGSTWASLVTFTDVSERKAAEEGVRKLLEEKELILTEVHHRIKNNLSVMASLFSLQAQAAKETSVAHALEEARSRLVSMVVLYERLYEARAWGKVDLGRYLEELAGQVVGSFPGAPRVELVLELQDLELDEKPASTLGIVLDELLTNAMKYAFPGGRPGRLELSLRAEAGAIRLRVADDGIGLPEGYEGGEGFGHVLVHNLALQLGGRARFAVARPEAPEGARGTAVLVEIPAPEAPSGSA